LNKIYFICFRYYSHGWSARWEAG